MKKLLYIIFTVLIFHACKKPEQTSTHSSTATLSGTVRDIVTNEILKAVTLTLITQSNFASYEGYAGTTDSLGRYTVSSDVSASVRFSKYGYYESTLLLSNYVPLNSPYRADLTVKLKMKPKMAVTGLIIDANNNPLDSVKINVAEWYPSGGGGRLF